MVSDLEKLQTALGKAEVTEDVFGDDIFEDRSDFYTGLAHGLLKKFITDTPHDSKFAYYIAQKMEDGGA